MLQGLSARFETFFESVVGHYKWLLPVIKPAAAAPSKKKPVKVQWPTTMPEKFSTDENIRLAVKFLDSPAAEHVQSAKLTLYRELKCLPELVELAHCRRDVIDDFKSKAGDAKAVRKRSECLVTMMQAIHTTCEIARTVPAQHVCLRSYL